MARQVMDPIIEAAVEAAKLVTWEDGYDRNGSHSAGTYVAYEEGLMHLFGDYGEGTARHYAEEIVKAALLAIAKHEATPNDVAAFLDAAVFNSFRWEDIHSVAPPPSPAAADER